MCVSGCQYLLLMIVAFDFSLFETGLFRVEFVWAVGRFSWPPASAMDKASHTNQNWKAIT
jgi:hypothetical protein